MCSVVIFNRPVLGSTGYFGKSFLKSTVWLLSYWMCRYWELEIKLQFVDFFYCYWMWWGICEVGVYPWSCWATFVLDASLFHTSTVWWVSSLILLVINSFRWEYLLYIVFLGTCWKMYGQFVFLQNMCCLRLIEGRIRGSFTVWIWDKL